MKIKVPTLQTQRLVLRMWKRADAAALFRYARSPHVGPAAGWKPHTSVTDSRTVITQSLWQRESWAVILQESGEVIGSIGLEEDHLRIGVPSKELGYSFAEEVWGQGYATEAARAVIRYAFSQPDLKILSIRTSDDNLRSQGVIRKCGFCYEGTLRCAYPMYDGTIRETRVYSLLREEYEERQGLGV